MNHNLIYDCSSCTSIRVDNYNLKSIGLMQKKTFLQIREYTVFCVPYEIDCKSCKLLAVLSPNEQRLFKQYEDEIQRLHLTIEDPETMENISIFINSKIKINKSDEMDHTYCFIDVTLKGAPESYTKLLKIFCSKAQSNKQIFENSKKENIFILSKYMDVLLLENQVDFRLADHKIFKAKIVKISYSKIIIITEVSRQISREISQLKKKLTLEFSKENVSFFVNATITDSSEVEGFLLISLDLDFSFSLVDSLNPLYTYYNKILSSQ